jgi:anti-sigma factor RsiW
MTYMQIDHVNAVMADRMRGAEHARWVREARLANKANRAPKPRLRRRFFRLRDPLRA